MNNVTARDKLDHAMDLLRIIQYALMLKDVGLLKDSTKSMASTLIMAMDMIEEANYELRKE